MTQLSSTFSTVNPFSVVIASNAAGTTFDVDQFKSGAINKPISIPGTYERLEQNLLDQIKLHQAWLTVQLKQSM